MKSILFALSVGLASTAAAATDVRVQVTGADGRPLAGAVVQIANPRAAPFKPAASPIMAQHNIAFEPHVLIVPAGSTVAFPNLDRVRHHVYSFSKTKKFELKLYGQDQTRTVTFDRPGVVALGCNIHDRMSGFVVVVDTPFAALSDAAGRVTLADVPAGQATISVWHPSIRAPGNQIQQRIAPTGAVFPIALAAR